MKSAFELALERSGGALKQLPEEIRKELSDLDIRCKAKTAEAELSAQNRLSRESDPVKIAEIREGLQNEILSIRDSFEHKKELVRKNGK